jgi:hypothetical protein
MNSSSRTLIRPPRKLLDLTPHEDVRAHVEVARQAEVLVNGLDVGVARFDGWEK